jgi:hypothetical protein
VFDSATDSSGTAYVVKVGVPDRKNIAYRAVTAATLRLKVVCAEEHKPIVP